LDGDTNNLPFESLDISDLPASIRFEDRERIKFLIAPSELHSKPPQFVLVSRGSLGGDAFQIPPRPWEALDRGEIQSDIQDPGSKNVGSVAFEHFDARLSSSSMDTDYEGGLVLKHLLEGSPVDSPFERDWSETRLGSIRRPMAIISEAETGDDDSSRYAVPTPGLRASPTPSALSLFSGSARTTSSWKASPTPGLSSKSTELSGSSQSGPQSKRGKSPQDGTTTKRSRVSKSSRGTRKKPK